MDIPYTVENRPDTGMYNGKLGMWLFLASEVMLFGALFSSYVLLRVNAVDWPKGTEVLNVPLATVNTLILIGSSFAMLKAWAALKMNDHGAYKKFAWITIAMGTAFILIKLYEYSDKFGHELYPSTSTFYAIYFTLTGLHVIHLLIGVLVNLFHVLFGGKLWASKPGQFTNRIEVTGLYWHFVDLVWLVMFPTLYLI
ncbi:MAG: cytochrome c oxidase subunit 3 [Candidatus Hydrogenedentota bacterium]